MGWSNLPLSGATKFGVGHLRELCEAIAERAADIAIIQPSWVWGLPFEWPILVAPTETSILPSIWGLRSNLYSAVLPSLYFAAETEWLVNCGFGNLNGGWGTLYGWFDGDLNAYSSIIASGYGYTETGPDLLTAACGDYFWHNWRPDGSIVQPGDTGLGGSPIPTSYDDLRYQCGRIDGSFAFHCNGIYNDLRTVINLLDTLMVATQSNGGIYTASSGPFTWTPNAGESDVVGAGFKASKTAAFAAGAGTNFVSYMLCLGQAGFLEGSNTSTNTYDVFAATVTSLSTTFAVPVLAWHDGDQFTLRIYDSGATSGVNGSFGWNGTRLPMSVRVTLNGTVLGTISACTSGQYDLSVPTSALNLDGSENTLLFETVDPQDGSNWSLWNNPVYEPFGEDSFFQGWAAPNGYQTEPSFDLYCKRAYEYHS